MIRDYFVLIFFGVALAGCGSQVNQQVSTNGAPTNVSPQPTKTQQPLIKPATIPDWCSNPPLNTVYRIYACGTAKSDNLSVAREMALLDAKGYLAGVISSAVDAVTSQQTNMSESSATTSTEITKKSETLDIPIRGYKSMESETLTLGGLYNHFILLEMEIGPAANLMNKVLDHTLELNKNRCPQGFTRYDTGCVSK